MEFRNLAIEYKSTFFCLMSIGYIVLALHFPVSIFSLAGHDDALFLKHAISLVQGNWLGSYDQMILAKGPGFSIFLALNSALGLPITLSQALLHCFAAWLLASRMEKLGLSSFLSLLLFAIILFNPQSFPTRIIRDNIYPALTLIIVSGLIELFLLRSPSLLKAFCYGSSIGWFWITREEGIWIAPGICLFVFILAFSHIFNRDRVGLKELLTSLAKLIGFSLLPILTVCLLNLIHYGGFVVVDFKEANFSRSLSLLNTIEPTQRTPHVPVNKEQRELAYSVSPTFAKLQEYFEKDGIHWTNPGCNVYADTCGDYAGGWFMWAYRDGAAQLGVYTSFGKAKAFFGEINKEIEAGCKSKRIKCRSASVEFLPHLDATNLAAAPSALLDAFSLLSFKTGLQVFEGPSMDARNILYSYKIFLGNPLAMPSAAEQILILNGWYYSKAGPQNWLSLKCQQSSQQIARQNSPDIARAMSDSSATMQRFHIEIADYENCKIQLDSGPSISLSNLMAKGNGALLDDDQNVFFLDNSRTLFPQQLMRIATKLKNGLGSLYSFIIPALLVISGLALIGILYCMIELKVIFQPLLSVAVLVWALIFTRVIILVLIDITSFQAIDRLYMGPAFPLLILAMVVTIGSFFHFSSKFKAI